LNCCCRAAIPAWDSCGTRRMRSLTPSLPPRLTAPAWDFASAARLSNRMVAACGLPTTLRAAQVFVSLCPPKPRHMNDTRKDLSSPQISGDTLSAPNRSNRLPLRGLFSSKGTIEVIPLLLLALVAFLELRTRRAARAVARGLHCLSFQKGQRWS